MGNGTATDENVVVMHDREFHLGEPTTTMVLAILRVIGSVAMRAEKAAQAVAKDPSARQIIWGLLAEMTEEDLVKLGVAVLQFEDAREGKRWLRDNDIKVAPLVQALMMNIRLSTDLVEALRSFFDGIGALESLVTALAAITPQTAQANQPADG